MRWLGIFAVISILSTISFSKAFAQNDAWQVAAAIRTNLFSAQGKLADDTNAAVEYINAAYEMYFVSLHPQWRDQLPELDTQLNRNFEDALGYVKGADAVGFALLRGRIWTGLLLGGMEMTLLALQAEDADTALSWLLVREFRPSTIISRPSTDAREEVFALYGGRREVAEVMEVVRADLLDTYQAKLNESLADADVAFDRGFTTRHAEEIGLASGYFEILASQYALERGEDALEVVRDVSLIESSLKDDPVEYHLAREIIDDALRGFVAAPLTDVELSRRAGQLLRFLAAVPVEYSTAVRNGVIVDDIEYQESIAFLGSARAQLVELSSVLENSSLEQVDEILAHILEVIRAQGAENEVQTSTFEAATTFIGLLPSRWRSISSSADIQAIRVVLRQVKAEAEAGEFDQALASCVHVYHILQESLEQKLLAFAPDVALRLDTLLWQGEPGSAGLAVLLATGGSLNDIHNAILKIEAALDEAELALSSKSAPSAALGNTAVIIFREGLEAVLILAALLASLHRSNGRQFRPYIIGGALVAIVTVIITWAFTDGALRAFIGAGAELAAITSLLAVAVMLLVTNWFFHRVYWTDRLASMHTRKNQFIAMGDKTGLFILGFTTVYREGVETALFLQPLTVNSDSAAIGQGMLLGFCGVLLIGLALFTFHLRLPYKKMLMVTGILIVVVLVTMVGNMVYDLQIASWIPIAPTSGVHIPQWMGQWFGVYPTWQGVIAQMSAATLVIASYFIAERRQRPRSRQPSSS